MGTPIGRILLMPKGDYDPAAVYNALDWVRYSGGAWVCKLDNTTGIAPSTSATTNWALMSEDGTVGGWSSIQNKPFETIGKGLEVPSSGVEEGQLKIKVGTTLLLGSKLDVNVQHTYTSSDRNPISGAGVKDALDTIQDGTTLDSFADVESALSGKADDSDLDEWVTGTGGTDNLVNSSGVITFTGINDTGNCAYEPYFNIADGNPPVNPTAELTFMNGSGTANLSLTYQTNLANGVAGKLRRIK